MSEEATVVSKTEYWEVQWLDTTLQGAVWRTFHQFDSQAAADREIKGLRKSASATLWRRGHVVTTTTYDLGPT